MVSNESVQKLFFFLFIAIRQCLFDLMIGQFWCCQSKIIVSTGILDYFRYDSILIKNKKKNDLLIAIF